MPCRRTKKSILESNGCCYFCLEDVRLVADVPLVEFMYLVFTCMPGESYRRRLRSLLLYLCYVFRGIINSLACYFCLVSYPPFHLVSYNSTFPSTEFRQIPPFGCCSFTPSLPDDTEVLVVDVVRSSGSERSQTLVDCHPADPDSLTELLPARPSSRDSYSCS